MRPTERISFLVTDRPEPVAATDAPADTRSPAQIERDIEATRERLASTIDAISDRIKPANVVRRTKVSLLSHVRDEEGALRRDRVGALAAGVVVVIGLVVLGRRRRR